MEVVSKYDMKALYDISVRYIVEKYLERALIILAMAYQQNLLFGYLLRYLFDTFVRVILFFLPAKFLYPPF